MKLSISQLKCFKSCRRMYDLRYNEGLYPVTPAEALETGKNYHELLERLYNGEDLPEDEFTKENAMAHAYAKYIFPKFACRVAEEPFEFDLGNGDKLIGRVDGIAEDGSLVEHKTTSKDITEGYEYDLMWDEQIPAYMLAMNTRSVYYTVVKKPTIRLKKDESEEEFYQRMIEWYDDDTENKIRVLTLTRTDDEVEQFRDDLMLMADELRHAGFYYRNTCNCNMYGRRCEYSSVCLHYDPNQEYVEFERRERYGIGN